MQKSVTGAMNENELIDAWVLKMKISLELIAMTLDDDDDDFQ